MKIQMLTMHYWGAALLGASQSERCGSRNEFGYANYDVEEVKQ